MSKKRCCPECFGDFRLRQKILDNGEPGLGKCDYCGSTDTTLIDPTRLSTEFALLANVYEPDPKGYSLVEWMKKDWLLFDHPTMDGPRAKELLADILDDGEIVRRPFAPSASPIGEGLTTWENLRGEMMYRNRWFLDVSIDKDWLEYLLQLIIAQDVSTRWHRARLCEGDKVYPIDEMGAPPRRRASHGRASPAGIPCLFLASSPETAVAEIRPHTGDIACVADFTIPEITAVDLRNPRKAVSPFDQSDVSIVRRLRADLPLLEHLGAELTRPVLPLGAAIDYIPSQYLCEFIRKRGFHGVLYRSAVSDGINLALFDPGKAKGGNVVSYSVAKVLVQVARVESKQM